MSRYLIKTLALPLIVATLIALALGYYFPWQGLFVNLATSLFSVLITILYVERVLQEHDRRLWEKVSKRIAGRALKYGNSIVLEIRVALGFEMNIFDREAMDFSNMQNAQREIARVTEHIIVPAVAERLHFLNPIQWKSFAAALERIVRDGDELINLYGNKLQPDVLQSILDIQEDSSLALASFSIIPDLLGVAEENLAFSNRDSTIGYREASISLIAKRTQAVLMTATKLFELHQ